MHVSLGIVIPRSCYKSGCRIGVKTEDETIHHQREVSTLHRGGGSSVCSVLLAASLASIVAGTTPIPIVDEGVGWYAVLVNGRLRCESTHVRKRMIRERVRSSLQR